MGNLYMAGTVAMLLAVAVTALLWPAGRFGTIWSGLLATPSALWALVMVPAYWKPSTVIRLPVSIEDVLWTFSAGALAWAAATLGTREDLRPRRELSHALIRWALLWGTAGIVAVVLWRVGVPVMTSTLAAAAAVTLLVAPQRRDLWPIALRGAIFFPILYGMGACAFVQLAPAFRLYWNHEALSGVALFGLPAEEIAWAVVWGATCPFLVAFASTLPWPEREAHTHGFRESSLLDSPGSATEPTRV